MSGSEAAGLANLSGAAVAADTPGEFKSNSESANQCLYTDVAPGDDVCVGVALCIFKYLVGWLVGRGFSPAHGALERVRVCSADRSTRPWCIRSKLCLKGMEPFPHARTLVFPAGLLSH